MKLRWAKYAIAVGAAALAGTLLTLEIYLNMRAEGMPVPFWEIAIPQFGRAVLWALLAPLIFQLREKLPPHRGKWVGGVTFHLAMSFVVMATYYLGRMWSNALFFPEYSGTSSFWQRAAAGFFGRNIIDMAYYWSVIATSYGLEIRRKYKDEELKASQLETRLIETELKALRQQMHPHFLFNTMNTISVLVREGRNDDAVNLVARLSTLLRMSLDNTGIPEVTLQQEMDFLSHYIDIQRTRFSDRLSVTIDVPPEALRARIPNLLLQPIVENAIIHGVAPKNGPGLVTIQARVEGDKLHLIVRDDGPGIIDGHTRAKEGVGLANTRERLAKIYGARSQLLLLSEAGRGVSVQIVLPFRT